MVTAKDQDEAAFDIRNGSCIGQLRNFRVLRGRRYSLPLLVTLSVDHLTSQQAKSPMATMTMPKTIDVIASTVMPKASIQDI